MEYYGKTILVKGHPNALPTLHFEGGYTDKRGRLLCKNGDAPEH